MRQGLVLATVLTLLGGCNGSPPGGVAAPSLEEAAIERGLVRNPAARDLTGLYARDTDRLCIVPDARGDRVGLSIDYGEGNGCSATGTVVRTGEALQFALGKDCAFAARFDGERITFPGRLPRQCATLCTGRASLTGVDVIRLSGTMAEAAAMRDAHGKLPCRG